MTIIRTALAAALVATGSMAVAVPPATAPGSAKAATPATAAMPATPPGCSDPGNAG